MSVGRVLELSLSHLSAHDVAALKAEAELTRELDRDGLAAGTYLPAVGADAFGFWITVPSAGLDPDAEERRERYPVIQRMVERAQQLECTWIRADDDAPTDEVLPLLG